MASAQETPVPRTSREVETIYLSRLAELEAQRNAARRKTGAARAVALAGVAAAAWLTLHGRPVSFHPLAGAALAAAAVAAAAWLRAQRRLRALGRRCGYYQRGLDRLHGNQEPIEETGEEFLREQHLYQTDLQILGKQSLFSLLCTTRTQAGAERLAAWLLDAADLEEARMRQESVRELRPLYDLREEIAVLGKYQFHQCDPEAVRDWLQTPLLRAPAAVRVAMLGCGAALVLLACVCLAQFLAWTAALPWLAALAAIELALSARYFVEVRARLRQLRTLAREFSILRDGLALLATQKFSTAKIAALAERVRRTDAAGQIRRLAWLLRAVSEREKDLFALPSLLVAAGTQLALAVDHWRAAHQRDLEQWLDCWAEFETLNAVAGYAFEHPEDSFPELLTGTTMFEAEGLGHPLLPGDTAVRNDIALDAATQFHIVSGSNMAGKSTWLKAVGTNAVLAYAGAPVRAGQMRLSMLSVAASNSIVDSLLDGKSRFLAEAERLRAILECSTRERPALFLVDEILSGTNSQDRRVASEHMVRALAARGAIGLLSTHDLALTEIASAPGLCGWNCCMESADARDPLRFDYRVRPGVTGRSSALAILGMLGIPVENEAHQKGRPLP